MIFKRRDFLHLGSLATASLMMPKFLKAFESKHLVPPGNKVLVVIQLSGGNDGLNTVIPVRNDIYYKERRGIAIPKNVSLAITDEVGLNPALGGFKDFYDNGSLGILNGVGYPNPDRSHFRSMDIWQSGSQSNEYISTGWLGRYLDAQCSGCSKPTQVLEVDDTLSLALKGETNKGLACKDPRKLFATSNSKYFKHITAEHEVGEETVDYLYKTMSDALSSAEYIFDQSRLHPSSQAYPASELGKNLKTIASLILSGTHTKVYYVSLGSFDTHVKQLNQQKRLFTELDEALTAFVKDMKANNRFEDVMVMTFSEFGRRVSQNSSGGTDHGTANNMFFVSGGLKQKGLLNDMPALTDLNQGDLNYTIDFKDVYATLLKKWLGADDQKILGKQYEYLRFI